MLESLEDADLACYRLLAASIHQIELLVDLDGQDEACFYMNGLLHRGVRTLAQVSAEPVVRDLSQVTCVVLALLILHGLNLVLHLSLHLLHVAKSGSISCRRTYDASFT